jgi:6-phosphogluconolactonase
MSKRYRILRDPAQVAHVLTRHIESTMRHAIERTGFFSLVLAGGTSPAPLYELLSARGRIDRDRVHVFWSDERCVPPDHPASNYRMAAATLFAGVAPRPDRIHRIPAELGCVEAAARYDGELATFFGARRPALMPQPAFDLVLLGMGEDGHTASLFPDGVGLISPSWATPAVAPAGVEPAERVTLTLAAIAAAAEVCIIVTSATKADMVARVLSQERIEVPAAQVSAQHNACLLLDRQAGRSLVDPPR